MIRKEHLRKILESHMMKRDHWHRDVPAMICWDAHKCSLQKLDRTNKTRIHKFLHQCLPTNKKVNDIDNDHPAKCPACNSIETNDHVTTCLNPGRKKLQQDLRTNIRKTLDKHNTHHQIKECMLLGLFQYGCQPISGPIWVPTLIGANMGL